MLCQTVCLQFQANRPGDKDKFVKSRGDKASEKYSKAIKLLL